MYLKTVDGKVIQATHLIECSEEVDSPFPKEKDGYVCYSKDDATRIMKILKSSNVDFKVIPLNSINTFGEDIVYENASEAREHLQKGKTPKAKKEKQLEERVTTLENQIKVLMNKLNIKF